MKLILALFFQWIEEKQSEGLGLRDFVTLSGMCVKTLITVTALFYTQTESTLNLHHETGK